MLASITPLVQRGPGRRHRTTLVAYLTASALAAAALGAILGAVGGRLDPPAQAALLLLAVAVLASAGWEMTRRRPASWRRQVNEDWLLVYRDWVTGAGFGAQLGLGVVTIVSSASLYAALLAEALTGSASGGGALGAAFGLSRGLPLLATVRVTSPRALARLTRGLAAGQRRAVRATAAAQAAVGLLGLTLALDGLG